MEVPTERLLVEKGPVASVEGFLGQKRRAFCPSKYLLLLKISVLFFGLTELGLLGFIYRF